MTTPSNLIWRIGGGRTLDLRTPAVMAILNVTPDSFSDGGELATPDAVRRRAEETLAEGADILDIGGESTRPGAQRVASSEQIRRVVPAIEAILTAQPEAVLSVDTTRAAVAEAAIDAGAAIVNDVSGGTEDPGMLPLIIGRDVGCVLMHRLTTPELDSYSDAYNAAPMTGDAVQTVTRSLMQLRDAFVAAGGSAASVVLDPGLGFGKTVEQNLELIRQTSVLIHASGRPVLSGLSRKSFVGRVSLGRDSTPAERGVGTAALTALHRAAGASVFRVHDVAPALEAIRAADALGRTIAMTR